MAPSHRSLRTLAAAGLAATALTTGVLAWLPSGASAAAAPVAAAPTPCPTDLTGVLCQATGGSSPTPSPAPSSSAPQPTPTRRPAPPAARGAATPAPTPSPSASPSPNPVVGTVQAQFQNAPYLDQLLGILNHPTSVDRPDLRHFRPEPAMEAVFAPPASRRTAPAAAAPSTTSTAPMVAAAVALLAVLLGTAALALAQRRGLGALRLRRALAPALAAAAAAPRLRRPLRLAAQHLPLHTAAALGTAGALLTGALAVGLAGAPHHGAGTPRRPGSPPSAVAQQLAGPALDLDASQAAQTTADPADSWRQLLVIEGSVTGLQDELVAQEHLVTQIAAVLGGHSAGDDASATAGLLDATRRDQLGALIAAHTQTAEALTHALQAEYDLYRAAATDPSRRAALIAAAARAPQRDTRDAVRYDLDVVQTQVQQEAQIDAAVAAATSSLAAMGSLSPAQLDAIRLRRPFIVPLDGVVTQPFGPSDLTLEPPLTVNGVFHPHFHTGIDLAAPLDTPVHAAADGIVVLAAASIDTEGHLAGYGNYVVIAHADGFVTLYGHLDSTAVSAGQVVHQGDIIGREGSTGWSTGPHLHFEIRHNGAFTDPATYLAGQLPAAPPS